MTTMATGSRSSLITSLRKGRAAGRGEPTLYWAYFVGFLMLMVQPMLGELLGREVRVLCLSCGLVTVAVTSLYKSGGRISAPWSWVAWVVVAALALGSHMVCSPIQQNGSVRIFLAVTVALLMSVKTTEWVEPALDALLLLCLVHAVGTVYLFLNPRAFAVYLKPRFFPLTRTAIGYKSGLTTHYSVNGQHLATGAILVASRLFREERHRERWISLFLLFTFALLLTTKRAHILYGAVAVSACYLIGDSRGKYFRYVMAGAIALLAVGFLASYVPAVGSSLDRLARTFEASNFEEATSGRTLLWAQALRGWERKPFLGNGWDSFFYLWPDGVITSVMAHNELLQLLHDWGVIGAVALVGLEAVCFVKSFSVARAVNDDLDFEASDRSAVTFAFAFQVFDLVYAYTSGSLLYAAYIFVPYLIAVGVAYSYRGRLAPEAPRRPRGLRTRAGRSRETMLGRVR